MAPLIDSPQVMAMREMAIDGACGPWSTAATIAASSSLARSAVGNSLRNITQIISGKLSFPIRSWIG